MMSKATIHRFFQFLGKKTHYLGIFLLFFPIIFPLWGQTQQVLNIEYHQADDGQVIFYVENTLISQAYISVDFPQLQNLKGTTSFPYRTGIKPGQQGNPSGLTLPDDWNPPENSLLLFALQPHDPGGNRGYSTSFQLRFRAAWGNPETAEPDDYLYWLPFEHGTKHQLTQGFNGKFTHFGENQFALDFDLDTGTPVYAARDGMVIEVKEDSNRGGSSTAYSRDANYILIAHEDGTFGNYVHLQQSGAVVQPGDSIKAGQLIAYSGNTGRSSGPHLHFDVRIPTEDGRMVSIPIQFRGREASPLYPTEGDFYYAYHPGLPDFDEIYGSEIQNEDYSNYSTRITRSDSIDFRTEEVDSSIIVFLKNGFQRAHRIEVQIGLSSMTSSTGTSVSLEVPGTTEVFLTILRPTAGATRASYRFQYRYNPL